MLYYLATGSLDGYVADADGDFQWAAPDEELHQFINDLTRSTSTILVGRRTYDLMDYWESLELDAPDVHPIEADFAWLWRAADKVVYSTTLTEVQHPRTRLEPVFDPDAVAALKASATSDASIGGSTLAGEAFKAGLVDEVWSFLVPTVVGGGLPMFATGVQVSLKLLEAKRFGNGTIGLHYRVR